VGTGGTVIGDIVTILSWVGGGAVAAYPLLMAGKFALSWRYAARREEPAEGGPVTVLQPILSGDAGLEDALRRNLELAPAWARFVWLIDEDDAEGRRVAERLTATTDRVTVDLCPPPAAGLNPKLVKLDRALPAVTTPFVAVLDDDTVLTEQNLERAVNALGGCDLYTGLPCYLPGVNFWSSLVAHFVNNNSILTYFPLHPLIGAVTINGMFYAMRTDTLRRYGGFAPVHDRLCDDYALATLVKRHGGVIRQGVTPVKVRTTVPTAGAYFRLLHRWFVFAGILVRDQPPGVALLIVMAIGTPSPLLWLGVLVLFAGWPGVVVLAGMLILRHLALRLLHRRVFGKLSGFSWWRSILAELLQPAHVMHSLVQPTIRWRTRRICPTAGGAFTSLPAGKS
jgi:ceramide glucosyltransferase